MPADFEPDRIAPDLASLCSDLLDPANFFVHSGGTVSCRFLPDQSVPWEVFRGRLLDVSQTRQQRVMQVWNLHLNAAGEMPPVLSIRYDVQAAAVHVTRNLLCHAWEGYHAGDNVYLSRETVKWLTELVGSVDLRRFTSLEERRAEIAGLLFRAVVGTSRLPLTSVEAPLPAFTLGELGYCFNPRPEENISHEPMHAVAELMNRGLHAGQTPLEQAKLLELALRAASLENLGDLARAFAGRWQALGHSLRELPTLFRSMFHEVALSPYTGFVDNTLAFLRHLVQIGVLLPPEQIDFLGGLLRQLGRHLTAYDLVTFHHAGANYPDALLLDAALKAYLGLIEEHPDLFRQDDARRRRRALRQAWMLRRRYEGHRVPDAPTSPGENARVLPPPFVRVPEEQITQPARRRRQLYEGDPLPALLGPHARQVLQQSVDDLHHPDELRELGMAVFIERPIGVFKEVGEPDQTLLVAQEAFSREVARERLRLLEKDPEIRLDAAKREVLRKQLQELSVPGLSLTAITPPRRPMVSLADARRVADDFVVVRTLGRGIREFLEQFDFASLKSQGAAEVLTCENIRLLMRVVAEEPEGRLAVFDSALRKRLELEVNAPHRYVSRGGVEVPGNGLRVLRQWDAMGKELAIEACIPVHHGEPGG